LPAAIQQRYKLAIIRYLQFCKQSHQPATVASARQLMRQTERGCPATLAIKCVAGLTEGSGRGSDAGFSIRKSTPSAKPSLSPVKRMVSALLKKLNGDSR
jgi:hypothetical protein